MEIQFGAAKVAKYATHESGDTLEFIERPHGGLSAVLVDGQRSGRSAKIISNIVARKAISLLGEGVRDGAAARAAHDYLLTHRAGRVSAELQIVSVDLRSESVVISRNTRCPALIMHEGRFRRFDADSRAIGIHVDTKPVIIELPLRPDTVVAAFTDGLSCIEEACPDCGDLEEMVTYAAREHLSAQALADMLLSRALEIEEGRPTDDISVLAMVALSHVVPYGVRRLSASFPV
ncbi:MAG: SpoIIE family protein phosphatase [Chloroflexota bacterium]|nr:SpoIIE family protein phosphatase [Chloroflexota bacterium]